MPTNLPPEAKKKWNEASTARNPREKLRLLEEFLSLTPKHKGTGKLRAQVKSKLATLRREIKERKHKRVGGQAEKFFIEKEGAAQIIILGPTNVGRSSLLLCLTNAKVVVSDYPFSTQEPIPGMFPFEDIQFQVIEAPALVEGTAEGRAGGQKILALARNADGLILMVDLSMNPSEQLATILRELENARVLVKKPKARVEIERKHMGVGLRILVMGKLVDCTLKDVEELLRGYRISNSIVKIYGKAKLDDVEDSIFESAVFRPCIVVANKQEVNGASERLRDLRDFIGDRFKIVPVSCKTQFGIRRLGRELFASLGIIRVYTKELNRKEPSSSPFILKRETTIADLAKHIHSDFYKNFYYARVWSKRLPFSPQKVGLHFILDDKDVVEMHMR